MKKAKAKLLRALLFFAFMLLLRADVDAVVDLEDMQQNFVLSARRITIPMYPDAFNPSIVRWKGSLLLSFRARDPITFSTNVVGFIWLDDDFNVVGDPMLLQVYRDVGGTAIQDPRMIIVKDELYVIYSNNICLEDGKEGRRVFAAHVNYDGKMFFIDRPDVFLNFEGDENQKWEKNWAPFEYNEELLLSYRIQPHKVFMPHLGTNTCETIATSSGSIKWNWGEIFGGTPASIVDGEYLAFFHSSCVMSSLQSNGKSMPHYFIGAYTFQPQPPFALTRISAKPIIGPKFYTGPVYKTWKPLRVVYPCGYVYDDKYIWITYGRQDHEVWLAKVDKKGLFKSLVKVSSSEQSDVK